MKKLSVIAFILFLLLSCFGAAFRAGGGNGALGAAETVRGMRAVVAGNPGTFVMQHGEQYLMAWPYKGQYAIAMIGEGAVKGLRQGPMPLTELVRALSEAGWKFATPDKLPGVVLGAMTQYSLEAAALSLRTLPSVFLVPVIVLTPEVSNEVIQ